MSKTVNLRFHGTFHGGLEFIEAENQDGKSVEVGTWFHDGDDKILQLEVVDD